MVNIFGHHSFTGLSDNEAVELLKKNGFNELPSSKNNQLVTIILSVLKEPMFLLLITCGLLYLFLGSINDALLLLFFVVLIIGTTIYQELKVENALKALKDLSSPRASVVRSGVQKKIPSREVVKGDLIILEEGDRVPADAIILQSNNLLVDESLLTGESFAVRKSEGKEGVEFKPAGGEDTSFVYSSTLVVGGSGVARVVKTGVETQVGAIGKELEKTVDEETILRKEIKKITKIFVICAFIVCFLIGMFYYLSTINLIDSILSALAIAMSILPEEFAVVMTLFLALGAWRMSKYNVLIRNLNAIQNIGSATVLCVDKTGTITLNKMVLKKAFTGGEEYDFAIKSVPKKFEKLLKYAVLASQKIPFDPMEKAIKEGVFEKISDIKEDDYEIVKEYSLSKKLLALSQVWESENKKEFIVASKGAPEAIIDLCHLGNKNKKIILNQVNKFSDEGYRVIGVASAVIKKQFNKNNEFVFPSKQHDFKFEFLGLIALQDPIRKSVPNAIKECYQAGIRVIMITGDYAGTAKHIALQAGLNKIEEVLTGEEIQKMSFNELKEKVKKVNIFARIAPEQKFLIVSALKANKEVVVMTGDGVNDAPALKSAHVGISMGARGTEVAREASAIVLIDDDFASIVKAVQIGRRIFDNIKKAVTYIIAIHIPIAGLALFPVIFRWPLIFFPVHIAFLELIIDPICSIAFESEVEEKNIMKRKPRKLNEPLFSKKNLLFGVLQGLLILIIVLTLYGFILNVGVEEGVARTIAFTVLLISNLLIVFSMRSNDLTIIESFSKPNKALYLVVGFAIIVLILVLNVPFLRELFYFSSLGLIELIFCIAIGFMTVIIFEGIKVYKKFLLTNNKLNHSSN